MNEVPHDAVHVRTIELHRSDDAVIFDRAASDDRVLVSADTDFGALLAVRPVQKPSVIQFRGRGSRRPDALAQIPRSLDFCSVVPIRRAVAAHVSPNDASLFGHLQRDYTM